MVTPQKDSLGLGRWLVEQAWGPDLPKCMGKIGVWQSWEVEIAGCLWFAGLAKSVTWGSVRDDVPQSKLESYVDLWPLQARMRTVTEVWSVGDG